MVTAVVRESQANHHGMTVCQQSANEQLFS